MTPRLLWDLHCLLGEGPLWLPEDQVLCFVDIKKGMVHRFDPERASGQSMAVGGQPSFIVREASGLLVGSNHAVYRLEDGKLASPIACLDQPQGNRTNDATVDDAGRLWFGTMDDAELVPSGALWCLDANGLHRTRAEAVVTNGPAVSCDGRWLYHVDSGERRIWRFGLGQGPELLGGEIFVQLDDHEGFPDGIVVDAEDCLWVALWDGWAVRRYSPEGQLLLQVDFPCARITKLAFGGRDLRTAFVTSASTGLTKDQLDEQPHAGGLFAFDAPAAGRILPAAAFDSAR